MSSPMFKTLESTTESRQRRGASFFCGFLAQIAMIGAGALLALLFPQELPVNARQYVTVYLPSLTPRRAEVAKAPPKVARVIIPKPQLPVIPNVPVYKANLELPKIRPTTPPVTIPVPQAPVMAAFVPPTPVPKVQKVEVRTGDFGGAPEKVTTKRPANQVQTGGFGSPEGFRGQAKGDSAGNVPKLGSFGLPEGPGYGNGTGGAHGVPGVVASAGFGSGTATTGYAHDHSGTGVATSGFEKIAQVAQSPIKSLPVEQQQPSEFQPIEVVSKPTPVYTEEARRLGIQGEVTLSVVFQANGTIRVLGVVKSLGHGLDQAAEKAASQIHFRPAQQNGKPVDFPANLRIEFRLADQNT